MDIDDTRQSYVLNCWQSARFHDLETDKKYQHVAQFLHKFLIPDLHRANVFFSS